MMHARDATRYARLAQGATLALAAAAVLVGFVSLPRVPEPAPPTSAGAQPTDTGSDEPALPVDFEGIIVRLASTHNAPVPQEEPQPETDQPDDTAPDQPGETTPTPSSRAPIRYLGALRHSGGKAWAIVAHKGKQTWLAVGGALDGRTLVEVDDDYIVVEDENGQRDEIPLAPNSATRVTKVTPGVTAATSVRERALGGKTAPAVREFPDARRRMIERAREDPGDH